MEFPGPLGVSARLTAKLTPWSVERPTRMPPLVEPPIAASHATYTLSRKALVWLTSTVIIGLSLKWFSPGSNENWVRSGQVLPPSVERATASSVPLMATPWFGMLNAALKNTTMNP